MKYLFFILFLATCKKATIPAPAVSSQPIATLHTFELKWFTNQQTKINYTFPSNQNQHYLISIHDTIANFHSVIYQYEEGIPNKYPHYLDATMLNPQNDTLILEIWIDGILKAQAKDANYADLLFNY